MEKLQFMIEEKAIAELFGRQSFTTKESAVFELIKNAFDAGAYNCIVEIIQNQDSSMVMILDDGCGMNTDDIKYKWMHVGKSYKDYQDLSISNRVLAGSKGIGRLALARIGNSVIVESNKKGSNAITWETDWEKTHLYEHNDGVRVGTLITINDLRDTWTNKDFDRLVDFLKRAYHDSEMEITIRFNEKEKKVNSYFDNLKIGINYVSSIDFKYKSNGKKLFCSVKSDEFLGKTEEIVMGNINNYSSEIDLQKELSKEIKSGEYDISTLEKLGDFRGVFYFSLDRVLDDTKEKYMYKHGSLVDRLKTGIILYRNSFSISSLEGKRDWLKLNSRSRKSPAAASHPTGGWRVRANQLSGYVMIDKESNKYLVDLANRQGLDENKYYELFVDIICIGIKEFERYRQGIIRQLAVKAAEEEEKKEKQEARQLELFLKKPQEIKQYSDHEIDGLVTDVIELKKNIEKKEKQVEEYAERVKYDVRVLNMLATQGLKASAVAHEFHTDRNLLSSGYEKIVNSLKKYGYWEDLNSKEKTKIAARNVPQMLNRLNIVNKKLIVFLDTMLKQISKKMFLTPCDDIGSILNKIKERWERDYEWIEISLNSISEVNVSLTFTSDVLNVIFDNLILNSIQNNQDYEKLKIGIDYSCYNENIRFKYYDTGKGLDEKFISNPFLILEVHESSRNEGHGLGMWIINNTLEMYDGKVIVIKGEHGFYIDFILRSGQDE